jgi:very-short-patch-repair endonuclease
MRYLDAEWRRHDGRRVVAEIDGANHLEVRAWIDDQWRQNEIALADSILLRFPSTVVRNEPERVAEHLRRALFS